MEFRRYNLTDPVTGQLLDYRSELTRPKLGDFDRVASPTFTCEQLDAARRARVKNSVASAKSSIFGGNNGALNMMLQQLAQQATGIAGATIADTVNQQLSAVSTTGVSQALNSVAAGFNLIVAALAAIPEMILVVAGLMTKNLRKWILIRIHAINELETITQRLIVLIRSISPVLGENTNLKLNKELAQAVAHVTEALRFINIYKSTAEAVFKYGRGAINYSYVQLASVEIDKAINLLNGGEQSLNLHRNVNVLGNQIDEYRGYIDEARNLMSRLVNIDAYQEVIRAMESSDTFLESFDKVEQLITISPVTALMISNLMINEYLWVIEQLVPLMTTLKSLQKWSSTATEIGMKSTIYGDGFNTSKTLLTSVKSKLNDMSNTSPRQEGQNILTSLGSGTEKVWCVTKLSLAKAQMLTAINSRGTGGVNSNDISNEINDQIKALKRIIAFVKNDYPKKGSRPIDNLDKTIFDLVKAFSIYTSNVPLGRKKVLLSLSKFKALRVSTIVADQKLLSVLNNFNPENSATLTALTSGYISMCRLYERMNGHQRGNNEYYAGDLLNRNMATRLLAGMIDAVVLVLATVLASTNVPGIQSLLKSNTGLSPDKLKQITRQQQGDYSSPLEATSAAINGYSKPDLTSCGHSQSDIVAKVGSGASINKELKEIENFEKHELSEDLSIDQIRNKYDDKWIKW